MEKRDNLDLTMIESKMIIAITGGIGSGKSYLSKLLADKGIGVYDCDDSAKRLMASDRTLQSALKQLVGDDVYKDNVLQKAILAKFLLASESNKQAVNAIVHPAVALDFFQSPYQWLESAILFESHFDRLIRPHKVVCVTAPMEIRIERIMNRDHITREKAMEWIAKQMPQEEIISKSDLEIVNDGIADVPQQLNLILQQIEQEAKTNL